MLTFDFTFLKSRIGEDIFNFDFSVVPAVMRRSRGEIMFIPLLEITGGDDVKGVTRDVMFWVGVRGDDVALVCDDEVLPFEARFGSAVINLGDAPFRGDDVVLRGDEATALTGCLGDDLGSV